RAANPATTAPAPFLTAAPVYEATGTLAVRVPPADPAVDPAVGTGAIVGET
ncbi:hypothetical protein LTR28_013638, partial [Elasticomyces elasticus]